MAAHSLSCLEKPMDRGAWPAIVHRVIKSHTRLKQQPSVIMSSSPSPWRGSRSGPWALTEPSPGPRVSELQRVGKG